MTLAALPVVYHPAYSAELPPGHRFPMAKFRLLYEHLLGLGIAVPGTVHTPRPAARDLLLVAHHADYVDAVFKLSLEDRAVRRIGFAITPGVLLRSRCAVAGTLLTARLALRHGIACNMAGGSHHAFADHGAGYCVFNDVVIAAQALLAEGDVRQVLVVDLDVHQGDGTAAMCRDDPRVHTFSMHCDRNFPATKQFSDRDVALPAGLDDAGYLRILGPELDAVLDAVAPDLVFYNAGVDPHADDRLGRLSLSDQGLAAREHMVLRACRERAVPVAGVLGGGYTHDLPALVARHALMFRAAAALLSA